MNNRRRFRVMKRLFAGIKIPESISRSIIQMVDLPDEYRLPGVENLHYTLQFFGEVESGLIDSIGSELADICGSFRAFEIGLDRFGGFPRGKSKRIVFVHGERGARQLGMVAEEIRSGIEQFGFHEEKPFVPHVTVARLKAKCQCRVETPLPAGFPEIRFMASSVILFESKLGPSGPVYTPLWDISLQPG
jgi:2'-5' RNA ligase